jgi:lambda family phage portal protein
MASPQPGRNERHAPPAALNVVDWLVSYLNPRAGLRRQVARELLTRAYEGASRKDGWKPRRAGASANTDHSVDAGELRHRARSLVQNVPYITRAIEALVADTVGTGIVPRSLAPTEAQRKTIDAAWDEWSEQADADGLGNFYSLQARAYRAMEVDGEVLIRIRVRRPEDGLRVPMQLQVLEIDWLDSSKNGTVGGNTIINGVEYTPLGKVSAYWLFDQHPGEMVGTMRKSASRAVPADRVIHLYNPERPGQGRGFSRLGPVIATVRDLHTYIDAEAARKNLETRLSVLASGDLSQLADRPEPTDASASRSLGELASGGITEVPPGLTVTTVEPKAAPGFVEAVKRTQHDIAAGIGVPYESMTGDMSEVNFSSARIRRMDYKRSIEQRQWLLLIPQLCQRVRRVWVEFAVLGGVIPAAETRADWSTPKWEYVNPVQDVAADVAEIAGGLSSLSEKLRQRGYKPDLVFSELKADLNRLQSDGVLPLLLALKSGNAQAAIDLSDPDGQNKPAAP